MLVECLALSREVGDRWGTAWALQNLASALLSFADLGQGAWGTAIMGWPGLPSAFPVGHAIDPAVQTSNQDRH